MRANTRLTEPLRAVMDDHDHVAAHLQSFHERTGTYPVYAEEPTDEHATGKPNLLYPAEPPVYVHVHGKPGSDTTYY